MHVMSSRSGVTPCAAAFCVALLSVVLASGPGVAASLDAPACNATGIASAAAAVSAWAAAGHYADPPNPEAPFYARSLTLGTLAAIHPCATDYEGDTTARDVAVVVMGSSAMRERLVRLRREWGARARTAGAAVIVVSDDAADADVDAVVLPGATDPSYAGAQNRSLMGLQHAVAAVPAARWYLLVDDDTVFNVAEAVAVVRHVQWRVADVVGHVYRGVHRFRTFAGTWLSGGGGMLISRAAATALAGSLFTPACDFAGLNDVTIGRCAHNLRIPLVHHHGFQVCGGGRLGSGTRRGGGVAVVWVADASGRVPLHASARLPRPHPSLIPAAAPAARDGGVRCRRYQGAARRGGDGGRGHAPHEHGVRRRAAVLARAARVPGRAGERIV